MNEDMNKVKLDFEILPIVFQKFHYFQKVRKVNSNELINRNFVVKEKGSFQINITVKPFYKKILI